LRQVCAHGELGCGQIECACVIFCHFSILL
jgi:hypothetical protein